MENVTRTNRQVFDIAGTITGQDGLRVEVSFDLIEMEDLVNGVSTAKYSYGVLRYCERIDVLTKARLLSATRLTLSGGGISASLCLYKLNSFTLTDTITEFRPGYSIAPAARFATA